MSRIRHGLGRAGWANQPRGYAVVRTRVAEDDPAIAASLARGGPQSLQYGDDRHSAELDAVKYPMPHARMCDTSGNVALLQLGQVKAGRKVFAFAMNDDRFYICG